MGAAAGLIQFGCPDNDGLEHLDLLAGNGRAAQPPNQFVGLAAEHRAGDNFNGAGGMLHARQILPGQLALLNDYAG